MKSGVIKDIRGVPTGRRDDVTRRRRTTPISRPGPESGGGVPSVVGVSMTEKVNEKGGVPVTKDIDPGSIAPELVIEVVGRPSAKKASLEGAA